MATIACARAHIKPAGDERVVLRAYLGNGPPVIVRQDDLLRPHGGALKQERQRDGAEEGRPALHLSFPCLDVAKFQMELGTRGIAERARAEGEGGT